MGKRQESICLPTSPSLSIASNDSTQLPTSSRVDLENFITAGEIGRLKSKHNRQEIPIMDDERFFTLALECVSKSGGGIDESELDRRIREESSRIDDDCVAAKIDISFADLGSLDTDDQKHKLIAGLQLHTKYGYTNLVGLVSYFVDQDTRRKKSSERKNRHYKPSQSRAQRPLRQARYPTESSDLRRSSRNSHKTQRRSARLEDQRKKNIRYLTSQKHLNIG